MRDDWQHFLARQGARIEDGRLLDFGEPQAELSALGGGMHLHSLQGPKLAFCRCRTRLISVKSDSNRI